MNGRVLAALLLVALGLRIPGLDTGLWYDEIWTLVDYGRVSFGELLTSYKGDNNHPFFTISAWISMRSFGESAWALRLPALLFGVASVGMLFVLGHRVATKSEATIATILLVISYHHVWFSQNARGYTALLFFILASTWFFLRLLDGAGGRACALYGVLMALGTYTHTTAVFAALANAVLVLVLLLRPGLRGPANVPGMLLGLLLATGLSLLLHSAILGEMVDFLFAKNSGAPPVQSEWRSPWWTLKEVARSFGAGLVPGLAALCGGAAVLVAGVVSYTRKDWKLVVLFLLPGIICAVVMIALRRNLWPRFFFFLAGFILLIAVRGTGVLAGELAMLAPPGRRQGAKQLLFGAGIAVAVVAFLLILPRAWQPKQDFEAAKAYIDGLRRPGEVVMTVGPTDLPYQRWLETDYVSIDSVEAMDRALDRKSGYVLHTLPTVVNSRMPEVAAALTARGREVKRFRGSLGGGDVVILQVQ